MRIGTDTNAYLGRVKTAAEQPSLDGMSRRGASPNEATALKGGPAKGPVPEKKLQDATPNPDGRSARAVAARGRASAPKAPLTSAEASSLAQSTAAAMLQNPAQSLLAQANQSPQRVLQLLAQ